MDAIERRPNSDELKRKENFLAWVTTWHKNGPPRAGRHAFCPRHTPIRALPPSSFFLNSSAASNSFLPQDLCICDSCCLAGSSRTSYLYISAQPPLLCLSLLNVPFGTCDTYLFPFLVHPPFYAVSSSRTRSLSVAFTLVSPAVKLCWAYSRCSGRMHERNE